jgi:hypothetical protein
MTSSSGTFVSRQKSPAPRAGWRACGTNSLPDWCRLIFCAPNVSARRPSPNVTASIPSART